MKKWKSKKCVKLTKKWAKKKTGFRAKMGQFSDECSVQRKSNHGIVFVFRFSKEALQKDLVNLVDHGKDISQMVWGSIWLGGQSELVIMERDEASDGGGYTANSYIKMLEKGLLPIYEPGQIFQQDNTSIHTAGTTKSWFESHEVWVLEWPPHSPDLSPIENLWTLLKRKIFELYLGLADMGRAKIDWTRFHEGLQGGWNALDQGVIDRLILSTPHRLAAVQKSKGWYTKY